MEGNVADTYTTLTLPTFDTSAIPKTLTREIIIENIFYELKKSYVY